MRIINNLSRNDTTNEAEALVKKFYYHSDLYKSFSPSDNIRALFEELEEVGVALTESQTSKLLKLAMEFVNNCNHCSNNGWKPVDLAKTMNRKGPIHMTIGPGMQKAIEEGTLDAGEMRKALLEMGIVPEF